MFIQAAILIFFYSKNYLIPSTVLCGYVKVRSRIGRVYPTVDLNESPYLLNLRVYAEVKVTIPIGWAECDLWP